METTITSFKFQRAALLATLVLTIFCALSIRTVQGALIVTLNQVGSNVVANGSGTFDLTGLTLAGGSSITARIVPHGAFIAVASSSGTSLYSGLSGPSSFGPGNGAFADSSMGDPVGILFGQLIVPFNYASGTQLSDSALYSGQTFATLGATPGTYVWSWGTGAHADTFTLQIGPTSNVPDSGSTILLMVGALAMLAAFRSLASKFNG